MSSIATQSNLLSSYENDFIEMMKSFPQFIREESPLSSIEQKVIDSRSQALLSAGYDQELVALLNMINRKDYRLESPIKDVVKDTTGPAIDQLAAGIESLSCTDANCIECLVAVQPAASQADRDEQLIRHYWAELFAAGDLMVNYKLQIQQEGPMERKVEKGNALLRRVLVVRNLRRARKSVKRDVLKLRDNLNQLLGPEERLNTGPWSTRIHELAEGVTQQIISQPEAIWLLARIRAGDPMVMYEFAQKCENHVLTEELQHDLTAGSREAELEMHLWLWQQRL